MLMQKLMQVTGPLTDTTLIAVISKMSQKKKKIHSYTMLDLVKGNTEKQSSKGRAEDI